MFVRGPAAITVSTTENVPPLRLRANISSSYDIRLWLAVTAYTHTAQTSLCSHPHVHHSPTLSQYTQRHSMTLHARTHAEHSHRSLSRLSWQGRPTPRIPLLTLTLSRQCSFSSHSPPLCSRLHQRSPRPSHSRASVRASSRASYGSRAATGGTMAGAAPCTAGPSSSRSHPAGAPCST